MNNYKLTSDFNIKSTALEGKITSLKSDLSAYAKKTDVASDITTIKNDYVTNASLTSQLNDLKSQHIAAEIKTINDKTKENIDAISWIKSRLKTKRKYY